MNFLSKHNFEKLTKKHLTLRQLNILFKLKHSNIKIAWNIKKQLNTSMYRKPSVINFYDISKTMNTHSEDLAQIAKNFFFCNLARL